MFVGKCLCVLEREFCVWWICYVCWEECLCVLLFVLEKYLCVGLFNVCWKM